MVRVRIPPPKKYRYASGLIRTQETAAPLASVLNMPVQDLSGLDEIAQAFSKAHSKTI